MTRWKASGIHLAISLSLLATIAIFLLLTWYPPKFLSAIDGVDLFGILMGVDTCIGPLLTLAVYKQGKPGLKFDLTVIAILQIAALGYGMYTVYWARPVYVAFSIDRYMMAIAADVLPKNLAQAKREEFQSLPLGGPLLVGSVAPSDENAREELFIAELGGGGIAGYPQYFVPYAEQTQLVIGKAQPITRLMQRDASTQATLAAYLQQHGLQAERVKYLPLQARAKDQTVLLLENSADILDIVDVDPWIREAKTKKPQAKGG